MNDQSKFPFRIIHQYPVWSYVVITFFITWGIKSLYASVKARYGMPDFNFGLFAPFGPLFAALILIGLTERRDGFQRIYRSMTAWRDCIGWIVLAAFFEPFIFFSITTMYWFHNGAFPESSVGSFSLALLSYCTTFILGIFRWGLSEEVGWKGWMLPKLQDRYSPFAASMIMTVVITLWHIHPNSFATIAVSKESEYLIGYFPEAVERLIISFPFVLVMTYIFNKSNGSLLAMMLFHSASNTSYFWIDETFGVVKTDFFRTSFLVVLIILAVVFSIAVKKQKNIVRYSALLVDHRQSERQHVRKA